MPISKKPGETKEEFISRCIPIEINSGKSSEQAAAICYNYWEEKQLSAVKRIRNKNKKFLKELEFEKQRVFVESANVSRMMWNSDTLELVVEFNDGTKYTYENISREIFDNVSEGNAVPKTSGENEWGSWQMGIGPSVGAALYEYIVRKDKGTKGGSFR